MAKKPESASIFSLRRALSPTPGYMYSVDEKGTKTPIAIERVKALGAQGQYNWKPKEGKNDINNIQTLEQAFLRPEDDRLCIEFGLKVYFDAQNGGNIDSCSSPLLSQNVSALTQAYASAGGFDHLAELYAAQLLNGSWMWRNRFGTDHQINIAVFIDGEQGDDIDSTDEGATAKLADAIAKGLKGERFVDFYVSGLVRLGFGQEVYPSQEFVEGIQGAADISRTYYKNGQHHGMMHSQKLGNALRRIDFWHPHVDLVGEIPVEPFGSSLKDQKAYRYGNKRSFYHHLDSLMSDAPANRAGVMNIVDATSEDDLHAIEDSHYFVAMLCRGGVLGKKTD